MIYYKYWVFYLLPKYYDKFGDILPVIVDPSTYIYAYTDNKDYADMFEAIHDMRYFKRKRLEMTSAQVHDLTLTERNKYMKLQSYSTRFNGGVKSVDIVVTLEERYAVEEMVRSQMMKWSLKMPIESPRVLKHSLWRALAELKYTKFWSYQNGSIEGSPFESITFSVEIDELAVYTEIFGLLLKGGI